ncbi:MAG: DUF2939 domain-containing protein [Candidatus Melainabacteria bacterium]|nr:DUF2939 domain-containing protein [Candidatus Melainabacteria bacterium]
MNKHAKKPDGKSVAKIVAITLVVLAILGGGGIFWWIHSPYYTIQQIGTAISKRDAEKFYQFCDAKTVVTTLTNELFLQPAMATHGMSNFQNYVAAGAIVMTKARLDNALLTNIDRLVAPIPHTSFYHVFPEQLYWQGGHCQNVYSYESKDPVVKLVAKKLDLREFARNLGQELKTEQDDLKRLAAQRMQEYASSHQDKLIGRLIAGPSNGVSVKSILTEYGFQTSNIKSMYVHTEDERQIATVEFFSPKVNANVPLSFEMTQITPGELFSMYRVIRVWKIKETMQKLGEDTDTQVQELIVCSLQDIAPDKAENRTGNLLKRLGQHESTKQLLKQLKGKF